MLQHIALIILICTGTVWVLMFAGKLLTGSLRASWRDLLFPLHIAGIAFRIVATAVFMVLSLINIAAYAIVKSGKHDILNAVVDGITTSMRLNPSVREAYKKNSALQKKLKKQQKNKNKEIKKLKESLDTYHHSGQTLIDLIYFVHDRNLSTKTLINILESTEDLSRLSDGS